MNQDFLYRNKRKIVFGIWGAIIFVIVWAIATYISHLGKVPVTISVVPSDATVKIDTMQVGNGTYWLPPKTYQASVSKSGFAAQKETLILTDQKQNVLAASLVPQSNDAKQWAAAHDSDYKSNEQYGQIEASNNGDYFRKLNPIVDKLPYTDPYFKIGYTQKPDMSITLTITTPSPRYRFYAVEQIRKLGYDPTDFVIEFKDFKNPLSQTGEQK